MYRNRDGRGLPVIQDWLHQQSAKVGPLLGLAQHMRIVHVSGCSGFLRGAVINCCDQQQLTEGRLLDLRSRRIRDHRGGEQRAESSHLQN